MKSATELFGTRIRELRKAQKLTQEQLADVLGIEQKHVSLSEHGKSYPSLDRLVRIAEALKVPLPSLFDFIYLSDDEARAQSLEELLKELDEETQQMAYRVCRSIIKKLRRNGAKTVYKTVPVLRDTRSNFQKHPFLLSQASKTKFGVKSFEFFVSGLESKIVDGGFKTHFNGRIKRKFNQIF